MRVARMRGVKQRGNVGKRGEGREGSEGEGREARRTADLALEQERIERWVDGAVCIWAQRVDGG